MHGLYSEILFDISLFFKGKAAPKEIEHRFSLKFPGMQCNIIQNHQELQSAFEKEIKDTLTSVQGCHTCKLKDVATPGCESTASNRKRKALGRAMEVLFSVIVKGDTDSSLSGYDVEEKSEAVLFQMQYAVATGQFQIALSGLNSTADSSSLQHLFTNVSCAAGFVTSGNRKGCGKDCLFNFFHHKNRICSFNHAILRDERKKFFIEKMRWWFGLRAILVQSQS